MTDAKTAGPTFAESPGQRRERHRRWLAEIDRIQERILEDRGGEPIPVEEVDRALDELRGRVDEPLD